jgi:hypothetical protein
MLQDRVIFMSRLAQKGRIFVMIANSFIAFWRMPYFQTPKKVIDAS